MNPKDIRTSYDPDLAGSYAAIQRAARSAQDLAIKTNTSVLVSIDGKDVELTAADLIKMREQEANQQEAADHDAWFRLQVQSGLSSANGGNLVSAEVVEAEFAKRKEQTQQKMLSPKNKLKRLQGKG